MEKQNITLSLPKRLLKRLKVLAAEQETSVSAIMERLLAQYAAQHEAYLRARQDHKALMDQGFDLGSQGKRTWSREEIHER